MIGWVEVAAPYGAGGVGIGVGIWTAKLVGQGITWTLTFFTGRFDKREAHLDAGMKELVQELKSQVGTLKTDCIELRNRVEAAESAHADCQRRLTEVERRAATAEATLQGMGDARNIIQRSLAADHLDENKAKPKG